MSFQSPDSDLARIARSAAAQAVPVDFRTAECLAAALGWALASNGVFDPVAAAGEHASFRDIAMDGNRITTARPIRIDLSGIAKGYAVDRAIGVLTSSGMTQAVVEAGGDLRVLGAHEELVALRPSQAAEPATVGLADGALASSDPALARAQSGRSEHLDGRGRQPLPDHFVAVAAPACTDADALTKLVLALGDAAAPLLGAAVAYRHDGQRWSTIGGVG